MPYLDASAKELSLHIKSTTADVSYPYHRHDTCEVFYFIQGNIRFYLEHTCYELSPGDLVVISPEEMHRIVCSDDAPYTRITLNVKESLIRRISAGEEDLSACFFKRPLGTGNILHLDQGQREKFAALCTSLEKAMASTGYGQHIQQNAHLALLLVYVNAVFRDQAHEKMSIMPVYILDTMKYIETHLGEPLSLKTLESEFHYHRSYISSKFKHHTGMTIRSYILDRRISRAKSLLKNGSNVTDACFGSGFNDYANFLRSFKKMEGISPGAYRKSMN